MSQTRPIPKPLNASRFFIFPGKPCAIFASFVKFALLVSLVVSISLIIYLASSTQYRLRRFPIRTRNHVSPIEDNEPTNISHILFGIGGSSNTWHHRSSYSSLWWDPKTTRGFVWLDEKPEDNKNSRPEISVPYRVSSADWTRFKYASSRSAVRIARIVLESFELGLPNVRWFVMGDDDTVFFTKNLVSVLARYDHNQMWYIGGNSESVEQDVMHSYDTAFGGGGFAVSYQLADHLVNVLDGCLDRYNTFYGSDERVRACISEIGVTLTKERGFHQFDIRGDPYGLLAAHPLAPLISLHHLDDLDPIFPKQTQINSLKSLIRPYRVDPNQILQQSFCYDRKRKWSMSIAWGYTVQIYPSLMAADDLQNPLQTFKTWSWSNGPFTFNTRPMKTDQCEQPVVYFLDKVAKVGNNGTLTSYKRYVAKPGTECDRAEYGQAMAVQKVIVYSMKTDPKYWNRAPRRQCCEILDPGSINKSSMRVKIRHCKTWETITI